jgi:hypothetical protein
VCREPGYDVAHIEPWSKIRDHTFENLIALCPNCHRRHHKGEIDNASLRIYKANLSIVNERYGEYERRVLEAFAATPDAQGIVLTGADLHVLYLVRDGLLIDEGPPPGGARMTLGGVEMGPKAYRLTTKGRAFVTRWVAGDDLDPPADWVPRCRFGGRA